jgi:hypothetical protein
VVDVEYVGGLNDNLAELLDAPIFNILQRGATLQLLDMMDGVLQAMTSTLWARRIHSARARAKAKAWL